MDPWNVTLAASANPGVSAEPKQLDPDLGTGTLLSWLEPFHGSDAMSFPSAQTGNKLLGRQQWPPFILVSQQFQDA
jgi:hypothetical protein